MNKKRITTPLIAFTLFTYLAGWSLASGNIFIVLSASFLMIISMLILVNTMDKY